MKTVFKHIICICTVFAVCSCEGFLNERKVSSLDESSVYSTEIALEKNINGIILGFQGDMMYQGNMLENLQSASGLVHWGSQSFLNEERWSCVLNYFTFSPSTSYNQNMYLSHYSAIRRCNKLIAALPDSPVGESYKKEIEAEARFYRAVLYFTLVRLYADVPLILVPATNEAETANPRTNYCLVYTQILKDLDFAFKYMRTPERVLEVTGTQGHPNRWAARSFEAAVCLQIACILKTPSDENFYNPAKPGRKPDFSACGFNSAEDAYGAALAAAADVIDNGPYKLAWNYSDLFRWEKGYTDHYGRDCWNLDERIFVLQSTGSNNNDYTARRTLPKYPEGVTILNPQSTAGRIRPTRYLFQKWCEANGGIMGAPDTYAEDIYVDSPDPRLGISLIYGGFIRSDTQKNQDVYPHSVILYSTSQTCVMPYYKKYMTPTYIGNPDVADYYFMRMSELYYIAAEASARLGNTGDAYKYVEAVHQRARRSTPDGSEADEPKWVEGQFADEDSLVNAIIWDKIFELCGEGHEFFEVRRYGAKWFSEQIAKPINEFLTDPRQDAALRKGNYYGEGFQYPSDPQKLRASLLCEFPKPELAMNPAMSDTDVNDYTWQ